MKQLAWMMCIFVGLSSCAWATHYNTINLYSEACQDNQFSADFYGTFRGSFGIYRQCQCTVDTNINNGSCSSSNLVIVDDGCGPQGGCCCETWFIDSTTIEINDTCSGKSPATTGYYTKFVCG